jgi:hypothetical protein
MRGLASTVVLGTKSRGIDDNVLLSDGSASRSAFSQKSKIDGLSVLVLPREVAVSFRPQRCGPCRECLVFLARRS